MMNYFLGCLILTQTIIEDKIEIKSNFNKDVIKAITNVCLFKNLICIYYFKVFLVLNIDLNSKCWLRQIRQLIILNLKFEVFGQCSYLL